MIGRCGRLCVIGRVHPSDQRHTPSSEMVTEAGDMHPTGMHSCFFENFVTSDIGFTFWGKHIRELRKAYC